MVHRSLSLVRLISSSFLLLGLITGCQCGSIPDAARSTVEVAPASGLPADGTAASTVTVTVLDSSGQALPGLAVTVGVSGQGNTINQPAQPTNDNGVATATVTSTVAETKTVTVTVEGDSGPVVLQSQPTITFIPAAAERLAFSAQPQATTAGAALTPVEVSVLDARGQRVQEANLAVTLTVESGPEGGALEGTLTVQARQGLARFSDLVLRKVGSYTVRASASGLTGATSSAFQVTAAAPAALSLEGLPAQATAGEAVSAEVKVLDAYGNVATQYTGSVTFSSTDTSAELPAGYTFTAADAGQRSFSGAFRLERAGVQRVTVSDAASSLSGGADVQVLPAAATQLAFTQVAASASVRANFGPVQVALQDAFGNTTPAASLDVTLELVQAGAALEGTTSTTPVSGVATFTSLSIARQGTYNLRASASGLADTTSVAFEIIDDVAPSQPELTAGPVTTSSITLLWTAVGDDGMLGTDLSHELRYSSSNIATDADFAQATPVTLAAPQAPGSAEQVVVSGLAQRTTYYFALRVEDDAGYVIRSATLPVTTDGLPPAQLAFTRQPGNGTAGTALAPVTVAIQDATGAVVPDANLEVRITVNPNPTGALSFTVQAVGGVATFDAIRINQAGTGYTLQATYGTLAQATSSSFNVAPAAAARLALTTAAGPYVAGSSLEVTVTAYDAFDNQASGYAGTVTFSSTDDRAQLPGSYTFQLADAGRYTFTLQLETVGSQEVTVSDAAGPFSVSTTVQVQPRPAAQLSFTRQPADGVAGTPLDPIEVTLLDASGNPTPIDGQEVTLTLQGATGAGPFTVQTVAGKASFDAVRIDRAGTGYTFEATSASLPAATSAAFTVAPAAADRLGLTATAGPYVAGTTFPVTVTAYDAYGNRASGYGGTVAFSSSDMQGALPPNYTFEPVDAGRRDFDVVLRTAGEQRVTVTDTVRGWEASVSVPVTPNSATQLAFGSQPGNGSIDLPLATVTVRLLDAYGNASTATSPNVTMSLVGGDPTATLYGTLTVSPVGGVASFTNLRVNKAAAGYQLQASAPALAGAASSMFDVVDPCFGVTCPAPAPACSADNTSVETYEGVCDPSSGAAVCRGRAINSARCVLGEICSSAACRPVVPSEQLGRVILSEFRTLGSEFIEIRNTTASPIDLRGYTLENVAGQLATIRAPTDPSGAAGTPVELPAGGVLYGVPNPSGEVPAGVGFVYGEPGTSFNLADSGDMLGLFSSAGLEDLVDFRSFVTNPNTAPGTAFVGFAGRSTQLDLASSSALSNDSALAWCVSFYPASSTRSRVDDTAGAPNGSCGAVVINEVVIDTTGTDDGKTFLELAGPGGALVGGVRIRDVEGLTTPTGTLNTDGDFGPGETDGEVRLPAGTRIPADGLLIVADGLTDGTTLVPNVTPGVDVIARDVDFENSGGDSIQLLAADNTLLDALGHDVNGNAIRARDVTLNLPMFEAATALYPPVNASLARSTLSVDTDNNRNDFRADPSATPGQPNEAVQVSITRLFPNNGPGIGTSNIEVTGTDLFEGMRLQFGTNTTTFACTSVTPTRATCSAPSTPGSVPAVVDVSLTIPASLKLTNLVLPRAFTYTNHLNERDVPEEADFCNLQFPASFTVSSGQQTPLIYGRLFEADLTEAPGEPAGVIAEVGYGDSGSNPTISGSWRFYPATYNVQVGNDDEFVSGFTAPTVTNIRNLSYTFRFSRDGGLRWTYCDLNGAGSIAGLTLEATQMGTMTVTP